MEIKYMCAIHTISSGQMSLAFPVYDSTNCFGRKQNEKKIIDTVTGWLYDSYLVCRMRQHAGREAGG